MLSTIFGGNTGVTYEELQARKKLRDTLMAQAGRGANTFGGGLANFGAGIAGGIVGRMAKNEEREMNEYARERLMAFMGGGMPVGGPKADAPPHWAGPVVGNKIAPPAGATPPAGGSVVDKIIGIESRGDPKAKNPNSSAAGLGQFIDSTWLAMLKKHRPDLVAGKSPAELIALKTDPALSRDMTAKYAEENNAFLSGKGLATTPVNTYLAHFLGPAGAAKVIASDPSTPLSSVVDPAAMKANVFLQGKTVGDLTAWVADKMGGAPTGAATPPAGATPPATPDPMAGNNRLNMLMMYAADPRLPPHYRQMFGSMLAAEMARSAPMDPYKAAQLRMAEEKLALDKRIADARMNGKWAGDTTVNVDTKGATEAEKGRGKNAADRIATWASGGDEARITAGSVEELGRLITQGGVGGTADALGFWLKSNFGINVGVGKEVEAFGALLAKLIPAQRVPGSGTTSDYDAKMFRDSLPMLVNSPEGNMLIIETMKSVANYRIALGDIGDKWLAGEFGKGDEGVKNAFSAAKALGSPFAAFNEWRKANMPDAKPASTAAPSAGLDGIPPSFVEMAREEYKGINDEQIRRAWERAKAAKPGGGGAAHKMAVDALPGPQIPPAFKMFAANGAGRDMSDEEIAAAWSRLNPDQRAFWANQRKENGGFR